MWPYCPDPSERAAQGERVVLKTMGRDGVQEDRGVHLRKVLFWALNQGLGHNDGAGARSSARGRELAILFQDWD